MKQSTQLLDRWQRRLKDAQAAYSGEAGKMGHRETRYDGAPVIRKVDGTAAKEKATHVRNVVQEVIETEVDSNIPQPKVTAVHEEDSWLAKRVEDFLRNELDRLPVEIINDEAERICPTQGGVGILVGWDMSKGTHDALGNVTLTLEHPKRIIPQDGVYQVGDMDWFFLLEPVTKRYVKRTYGVDVEDERESDPDVKNTDGTASDQLVTMKTAYYRNDEGGIGRYVWVNDLELEHLKDYQVRRICTCKGCGTVGNGVKCRRCGGKRFEVAEEREWTLTEDIIREHGGPIPAMSQTRDEYGQPVFQPAGEADGILGAAPAGLLPQLTPPGDFGVFTMAQEPVLEPTKIPYYKPDLYPLVLRKNISRYGRFLGISDVDTVESHQNTMNKLTTKINRKVLGGGSFVTKPKSAKFTYTDEDGRVLELESPKEREMIGIYNLQMDTSADRALLGDIYEQARQEIGITDSMQGRKDPTATSAVAKQFSAQQAAGRMESKKILKQAAFAQIFELIFKFWLAYADAPASIASRGTDGEVEYSQLSPTDFLKQDAAGMWYYNTDFLFSCDTAAPLAGNREAMWQETRMNFQQGAFGSPQDPQTLLLFWTIMEQLQYPLAATAKSELLKRAQDTWQAAPIAAENPAGMEDAGIPQQGGGGQSGV